MLQAVQKFTYILNTKYWLCVLFMSMNFLYHELLPLPGLPHPSHSPYLGSC